MKNFHFLANYISLHIQLFHRINIYELQLKQQKQKAEENYINVLILCSFSSILKIDVFVLMKTNSYERSNTHFIPEVYHRLRLSSEKASISRIDRAIEFPFSERIVYFFPVCSPPFVLD